MTRKAMVEREWDLRRRAERALYGAESPRVSRVARRRLLAEAEQYLSQAEAVRELRARGLTGRVVA